MKQLLAWTGSGDSTITSEAVMAMAEKIQHGTGGLLADPQRAWSMQVKEGTLAGGHLGTAQVPQEADGIAALRRLKA